MTDVTQLLADAAGGDRRAAADLLPLVYAELRHLAVARMADEPAGHSLNPTALVHEAYLRLVNPGDVAQWDGRGHFFAAAAEAMRRILIEKARHKQATRHGGEFARVNFPAELAADGSGEFAAADLLAVDDVLDQLAEHNARAADFVKLHVFVGLSLRQAAETLGLSNRTGLRTWAYARAWMFRRLGGTSAGK